MISALLFLQASADCNVCDLLPKCGMSLGITATVLADARLETPIVSAAARATIATAISAHVMTPCAVGTRPTLLDSDNCCPSCNPGLIPWDVITQCAANRTRSLIETCPRPASNCQNGIPQWDAQGCPTCIPIPKISVDCNTTALKPCDDFLPFLLDLQGCPSCRPPPPCEDGAIAACRKKIADGTVPTCGTNEHPVMSNCCVSCVYPPPPTPPPCPSFKDCLAARPECTSDHLDLEVLLSAKDTHMCCYGCRRPETRWPAIQVAVCKAGRSRCVSGQISQTAPGDLCGACNDAPAPCSLSCAANQVCVNTGSSNTATCKDIATYVWNVKSSAEIDVNVDVAAAFVSELVERYFERPANAALIALKRAIIQGLKTTVVKTTAGVQITVTAPQLSVDASGSASAGAGRRLLATSGTDQVMSGSASESPYETTSDSQKGSAAQVGALLSVFIAVVAAMLF